MSMIKALIFDFDGVVIDTETPDYDSWQEIYRSYGAELERSIWQRVIGGNTIGFDVFKHLEDLASVPIDREDIRKQRRNLYLEQVEANPILPGVVDYIAAAQRLGLKLGVASSSDSAWVKGHLARRDLLKHFHSVKCSDDVSRIKPDPELYLAVMDSLGISPSDGVAIEDSLNGVNAAKSAGLLCVAVPNPMTRDLPLERSDLRLGSLSELTLEALLSKLNAP